MLPTLLLSSLTLCAAPVAPRQAPLLAAAPVVDGRVDEAEWAGALRLDGFAWQGRLERRRATAYLAATPEALHLAIVSQLPVEGRLVTAVDRDTPKLVYDDSVEVWLDPDPAAEHGAAYQLLANSAGRTAYLQHPRGHVAAEPAWRGGWPVAHGFHDGAWHAEITVPLAGLAPGRRADQGVWGLNLCRNWKQPWAFSSSHGLDYATLERFVFAPGPIIRCELAGDPFVGDLRPTLRVRGATRPVTARIDLTRDLMPELFDERTFTGDGQAALTVEDGQTRQFTLAVAVREGERVLYERRLAWSRGDAWAWTTTAPKVLPLDFQFAYWPSDNQLKALVDITNLPAAAKLDHALLTLREKGGRKVAEIRFDSFEKGLQERRVDLPPLAGSYELALTASGTDVPEGELVKPLERQVFEWERNQLGRSRTVYPPFEPLRLEGDRLHATLRDHVLGQRGLPAQITARDKALLAGPIRFEGVVGGQPLTGDDGERTADVAEDRILVDGRFTAAGLDFGWRSRWDVDGLVRYELTLPPTDGRSIDSLDLVIPCRADQATHLHALGDGIRNTIYTRLPAGEGVLWDSTKVASNDLPANFCSYFFLGTPLRGLSWCAENDAGWSWDPATPNVTLDRRAGQVIARVHLINRPLALTEPRTIVFGLQAAPIKERLRPWRYRWRRDNYTLLGTDINWLALGSCGSVYPAGGDLYFWEMIRRGNTEKLPQETIQEVIERGRPLFAPYGMEKSWEAHVRHNLQSRYGKKMVFYYNRASCQLHPEFQVFEDEWGLNDWRSVGPGKGFGEIKIVPSPSYIDHAVWWYDKSFTLGGNQGVYWDNWFFCGSYNTHQTSAWRRPDGSISPSTGLWGLRELCRRTFQLMNERDMLPLTMPHMTSTNILPLHGFATVQYDWEWKYSTGDVQNRFSRDYILLVSTGELAGTWPVLLQDHGPQERDPWVQRTFAAVCLVHELDCWGLDQVWRPIFEPVHRLLDDPACRVWRYWDEEPSPITVNHPDLPAIVYALPGREALLGVVSYADGEATAPVTIDPAALGLKSVRATNQETGETIAVTDNRFTLTVPKHDLRLIRLTPGD